jgi:hypothetical protein
VAWSIHDDVVLTQRQSRPWPSPVADTYHILKANPYQLQLENFAAVLRGDAEPDMPLATSVVNTYTIEALVTSALERRIVEVDIPAAVCEEVRR